MTRDEQEDICRAIAVSCMWGNGGIAATILERLDRIIEAPANWSETYRRVAKEAQRSSIGTITDKAELDRLRARGYWLVNFDEDGCSLFNPPPMNGLYKYVSRELADREKAAREKSDDFARRIGASMMARGSVF